jgi:transcriptional antiterminator NusG
MSNKEAKKEEPKIETDFLDKNEDGGEEDNQFLTTKQSGERNWYVIHTYSGYEDQVADSLKQRIGSLSMQDKIFDVIVPKEKQIEIKNGKRKTVAKRIFPGYVLVDMIVTDDSWYVVRNTPNVTGFIGFGVRPTPMSKDEIGRIKKRMGVEEPKYKVDFSIDELVRITDGALKGFEGKVEEINEDRGTVRVLVSMFGRETPVNLDFLQVKKV